MNLLECVRLIRADSGMQPVIRATVTDEEWSQIDRQLEIERLKE